MFHEVRMNSYSIDAIFREDRGAFSQPEIIELNQSFLKVLRLKVDSYNNSKIYD